jgi:hypothetical protein
MDVGYLINGINMNALIGFLLNLDFQMNHGLLDSWRISPFQEIRAPNLCIIIISQTTMILKIWNWNSTGIGG